MAAVSVSNPRSLPNPTEDQLEELEGLIRRMLDLPVVQLQESSDAPAPIYVARVAPPALPGSQAFHENRHRAAIQVSRELPYTHDAQPPPVRIATIDSADPDLPTANIDNSHHMPPAAGQETTLELASNETSMIANPIIAMPSTAYSSVNRQATQHYSRGNVALFPLIAINWTFDVVTFSFGPLGRWFREPGGRAFLGICGFLMLAGAAALGCAQWMGLELAAGGR